MAALCWPACNNNRLTSCSLSRMPQHGCYLPTVVVTTSLHRCTVFTGCGLLNALHFRWQCTPTAVFMAEMEPGHGSPGQRFWPGRVGSRVKNPDPVPSLLHGSAPEHLSKHLQRVSDVSDYHVRRSLHWSFLETVGPQSAIDRAGFSLSRALFSKKCGAPP